MRVIGPAAPPVSEHRGGRYLLTIRQRTGSLWEAQRMAPAMPRAKAIAALYSVLPSGP